MSRAANSLRTFGEFALDLDQRILWVRGVPAELLVDRTAVEARTATDAVEDLRQLRSQDAAAAVVDHDDVELVRTIALGARSGQLLAASVRRALRPVWLGILVGTAPGILVARLMVPIEGQPGTYLQPPLGAFARALGGVGGGQHHHRVGEVGLGLEHVLGGCGVERPGEEDVAEPLAAHVQLLAEGSGEQRAPRVGDHEATAYDGAGDLVERDAAPPDVPVGEASETVHDLRGLLGVVAAGATLRAFVAAAPIDLPRLAEVRLDVRVWLFAFGLSLVCGLLSGLVPALRLAGMDPQGTLRAGSRSTTESRPTLRLRETLVAGEVALSTLLLVLAGLLVGSLVRLQRVDKGFRAERAVAVNLQLPQTSYPKAQERSSYFDRALASVRSLPGVQSAAFISKLPLTGEEFWAAWRMYEVKFRETRTDMRNPEGSPSFFPFLFVTIACGAISGFHCLVSSGTSSKQLKSEADAHFVGYGSMLTEGFLAVLVILSLVSWAVMWRKWRQLREVAAAGRRLPEARRGGAPCGGSATRRWPS